MNIFVLDESPQAAAELHIDKHCVKMVIEYAQLLSTAHRILDGTRRSCIRPNGRPQVLFTLQDEELELLNINGEEKYRIVNPLCYGVTHQNHPSAIWARQTRQNYLWLYSLFQELAQEYTFRYDRIHKTWNDLGDFLKDAPRAITDSGLTQFAQAMGDEFKVPNDAIKAYRNYYNGAKASFATWKKRETPEWFSR